MQQLTLQFEGFADSRQPETRSTAKQCSQTAGSLVTVNSQFSAGKLPVYLRQTLSALRAWLAGRSETFTALCGSEGEVFTHGDVVKANASLVAVIILIGIGGAL